MFYSQFILAKKGPLGTIWIAAHLERKLRKNQVADTDIGVSVDSIIFPEAPIALRLSSHLLLGVVRIYNRKVNYLFDDCSEALLNVKQAFRSTAVDLPPEESKAPYHSITLPENFDLDDFELPDSDIFKGNYVDHHISSRDQITLQDSMEGVSYSTSKFGLDERFGDGDASGLDLDEELFMNKIETADAADESVDPQTSYRLMSPLKPNEHPEDMATNSENMAAGADEPADVMDYAQAPSTPGLVEEPNLSNAKNASACDDHMESEYHLMDSTVRESNNNVPYEDKQEVEWCSRDDTISDAVHLPQGQQQQEEKGDLSSLLKIKESEPQGGSPTKGQDEDRRPTSEFTDRIEVSDVPLQEDFPTEDVKEDKSHFLSVDETNNQGPDEVVQEKSAFETSGLAMANIDLQVSKGVSAKDQQTSYDVDGTEVTLGNQVEFFLQSPESQAHDKEVANVTIDSGLCNSVVVNPDVTVPLDCTETDADAKYDTALLETIESEETIEPGKDAIISNSDQILKENLVQELASGEDVQVAIDEPDGQVHKANSQDTLVKNLNNITEPEFPAPEKLLSVLEGLNDSHRDMLVEVSPSEFEGPGVIGDAGSKSVLGKKRSFTESTLTEHSLNSIESSRQVRFKRTTGSVPDDDDLLSSILAGRNSSVLKVKPTPPLTEVTSIKRTRALTRSGAPKRKVLVDDTMVLHGDMIRHQLTNTEDIRRIRKKAPCTLSEISMIQKQHMEDDIFLGTIFTGMAVELTSLHGQTYDMSRITVSKDDVNLSSLDTVTEARLPSQDNKNDDFLETIIESNLDFTPSLDTVTEARLFSQDDKNDASIETIFEPNLASMDDNYLSSLVTMDASHLTSPYNVNQDEDPGENNATKKNDQVGSDVKNPLPIENKQGGVNYTSIYVDFSQEGQTKPTDHVGPSDFTQEPLVSAAEVGIFLINAVSENPSVMPEVEPVELVQTDSLNEFSERISDVNMDASADAVPDQMVSRPSVELDYYADIDGGSAIDRSEVAKKDAQNEVVAKDDILPDMVQDAAVEIVQYDTNHEELGHNLENEFCNINTLEEQIEVGTSHEALVSGVEYGFVNNDEYPNQSEAYLPTMTDAGLSGFDLHDHDDISYSAAGYDTGFLNVDDDELTEIADDHMPDDEETQFTDNSGWSSRTRAVSKYLQTAFVKERERGKKSLSMDNLLIGKSRKEASRMFFETLVLKTRDYIHVEQPTPYDDITLKPRPSLMKSDF